MIPEETDGGYGKIRITGKCLDLLFTNAMDSKIHLLDMLEYDRANDTWVFLAKGPDFPYHMEGCPAPFIDAAELRRIREFREREDD